MSARRQTAVVALVAALAIAIVAAGRTLLKSEIRPVGVGVEAPDFAAFTVDSTPTKKTLADYRGDVLMLNFWATWCGPCRIEMPSIEELHRAYAAKGLKIVAISVDEPGTDREIRRFAEQYGLTFEVLHDPEGEAGRVSRAYQVSGYPETVIIGRDGTIRRMLLGAHNWNSAENRALVERLLAEKAD